MDFISSSNVRKFIYFFENLIHFIMIRSARKLKKLEPKFSLNTRIGTEITVFSLISNRRKGEISMKIRRKNCVQISQSTNPDVRNFRIAEIL